MVDDADESGRTEGDPPDASATVADAAMVAVSVDVRFVGAGSPAPDDATAIERALHEHLKLQQDAIKEAATESMTAMPGAEAKARVMQGSIEVLVVISFALGLLRSYNEYFDVVETATRNTRRLVERLADAFLVQLPDLEGVQVFQGWHAATTASWWLAPGALAAAGKPEAQAAATVARRTSGRPVLPAIDFRAVVLWVVGVITFLTALYVVASILLELFAD